MGLHYTKILMYSLKRKPTYRVRAEVDINHNCLTQAKNSQGVEKLQK